MKNNSTLVAALVGLLLGTAVGAGTFYSAQVVSYRYGDIDGSREQYHRSDNRPSEVTRTVNTKHRAASGMAEAYEECEKFSPRRRGACMEAADRETNEYTGAQYDEN
ncbi:hypothetical protein A3C37_00280 [Candidatus Peribacteria bacterium RIFCSPHIGHO2_02_FULL_53_20]|nr:MAG: hypothetical protein A3C37_00280 [Candidatus Peribacteria bacterium RIFCSPHIGHO2_02_FULL_53_20]OGJ67012.1 MAG: hypothetical protein A3B61_04595 [Candidatus Peribacteria bacterium RIFCSPLOWO2_01_FULL_53_10]OGJ71703.1 MAG: hypothetical protein A3G69_04175 [Candidatus Peribacteria bacterium RIFCSPLOWO2_12_FULL_53_10]